MKQIVCQLMLSVELLSECHSRSSGQLDRVAALLLCAHPQNSRLIMYLPKSFLKLSFLQVRRQTAFSSHVLSSVNGLFYFPPTVRLWLPGSWDVSHQHNLSKSTKSFEGKCEQVGKNAEVISGLTIFIFSLSTVSLLLFFFFRKMHLTDKI